MFQWLRLHKLLAWMLWEVKDQIEPHMLAVVKDGCARMKHNNSGAFNSNYEGFLRRPLQLVAYMGLWILLHCILQ